MSMHDTIAITIEGHGVFATTAGGFDRAIAHYLPASPYGLRQKIDRHENNTFAPGHYDGLITVTEYLMVLAHLDNRPVG